MSNPSAPRITARIDLNTQALLLQATRLSGVASVNSFVVNAAVEKAKAILQAENIIKLNQESSLKLMTALSDAPIENAKLIAAFKEHSEE